MFISIFLSHRILWKICLENAAAFHREKALLYYERKENADKREEITEEQKEVNNDMILSMSSYFSAPS